MARRDGIARNEPIDGLDYYPTPPWATRALIEQLHAKTPFRGFYEKLLTIREPAAGSGHMVKVLKDFALRVEASDIHDYGAGFEVADYLSEGFDSSKMDWTITNPPYNKAEEFIEKALGGSNIGVAMLLRTGFVQGEGRYRRMFSRFPPEYVFQFSERVHMVKDKLVRHSSPMLVHSWFVWEVAYGATEETKLHWIPPCRKRLEKDSDYE